MADENPIEQALLSQIDERRKADPLIGAKLGAKEVTQRLMAALKNEKGVHVESLLCALGALAGYSCQAAVRAQARARSTDETSWFTVVQTKDGKRYFFGDRLNHLLLESKYSVWSIAAAGAQQAGSAELPNVAEIAQHTATVLGSDAFGQPRIPENHASGDLPVNYARALWPKLQPLITKFCPDPMHWPVLFALSAQETIIAGKSVLDPSLALRIVMEAAIPISTVDLGFGPEPMPPARPLSRPARPTAPRTQPSNSAPIPEERRSKAWIGYWLVIIMVGAWQLSRITGSLTTIVESPRTPSPATNNEAPPAVPAPRAPMPPARSTSPRPIESAAAMVREAEYIPDEQTISDFPALPPAPAPGSTGIEQPSRR